MPRYLAYSLFIIIKIIIIIIRRIIIIHIAP